MDEQQARWFHTQLKGLCDAHDPSYYRAFSERAASYFYLPHRKEHRGIGGIFFDRLPLEQPQINFVFALAEQFVPWYTALTTDRSKPFSAEQRAFQQLRRGRYVEFNLVYDQGTKFGFQSEGRTESILMSLPPGAAWSYAPTFAAGTAEARTLAVLRTPLDWIG